MKVTTEARIYLVVYLSIAGFLILQGDLAFTVIGGIVALFGFVMVIFTRLKQITRILKKNNLWIEEQLDKKLNYKIKEEPKEDKNEL